MNTELLKSKIDHFFANTTPEYLVSEFEKMGYTFIESSVSWNKVENYGNDIHLTFLIKAL